MHMQAFTPLMTSLTMSVICCICAQSHHRATDESDTFAFSPVVGYLMAFVGLSCCVVPFLPGAAGKIPTMQFFLELLPFCFLAFAAAAFFFLYRVVVRDESLTYGAFLRRVVPFSEVIDYDLLQGNRSAELWVYVRSGRTIRFSGILSGFDELVALVNSHMAGLPGPRHDSPAKIEHQRKRKRQHNALGWVVPLSMGIVGLVVFVLWRMQLLH